MKRRRQPVRLKRCRHDGVQTSIQIRLVYDTKLMDIMRCWRCGCQMPMGQSRDTPEVEIEIRAVELADLAGSHATRDESDGWRRWPDDPIGNGGDPVADRYHQAMPIRGWTAARWAGWLGREINEHDKAQRWEVGRVVNLRMETR